jgi:hypothetical protein
MSPHARAGGYVAASRIPVNVRDTIVLGIVHQHQISGEVALALGLVAFVVEVPELEVEETLHCDGGDDDEPALGRPVDAVAVLLIDGADELEVALAAALQFLGAEK